MSQTIQNRASFRLEFDYLNRGNVVCTILQDDKTIISQIGNDSQHALEKCWQIFDKWLETNEMSLRK